MIQKIAIIPDVHGRKFWRRVVEEDADKIIFLGDYGDPYGSEEISHKDALIELEDIIRFQEENPNKVVLLLGNHDAHYLSRSFSPCSRYSHKYASEYYDLLANRVEFYKAYECEQNGVKYLFTHAGVSPEWLRNNHIKEEDNLSLILNEEHWDLYDQSSYLRGGYFLFGSPLWADIREHASSKERLKDYIQIFGHTMLSRPYFEDKIICLDCKKAFILENNEIKEF